jgi:5-methylcytosine-specific restriction endonuclease McrA
MPPVRPSGSIYGTPAWHRLRGQALKRDGYRCTVCGVSVRGRGNSRVDHVLPVSTYPQHKLELANLRTLCPSCDNKRHAEKGGKERPAIGDDGVALKGWGSSE